MIIYIWKCKIEFSWKCCFPEKLSNEAKLTEYIPIPFNFEPIDTVFIFIINSVR